MLSLVIIFSILNFSLHGHTAELKSNLHRKIIQCEDQPFPEPPCCGYAQADNLALRVFGGTNSKKGEISWMVNLMARKCGGFLINSQWILTAAHCQMRESIDHAILGSIKPENHYNESHSYVIKRSIPHPQFKSTYNDIALLQLNKSVTFNDRIQPVCLDYGGKYVNDIVGKMATISGWGKTSAHDNSPQVLQKARVEVWKPEKCESFDKLFGKQQKRKHNICAGGELNVDACAYDSGGPLTMQLPVNGKVVSPYYGIGVVSYGGACGLKGYPGVYTNISTHIPWIKKTIKENSNYKI